MSMNITSRPVTTNLDVKIGNREVSGTLSQKTGFGLMINKFKAIANTVLHRTSGEQFNSKFTWKDEMGKVHTEKFNMEIRLKAKDLKVSDKIATSLKNLESAPVYGNSMINIAIEDKKAAARGIVDGTKTMQTMVKDMVQNAIDTKEGQKQIREDLQQLARSEETLETDLDSDDAGLTPDELAQVNAEFEALEKTGELPEDNELTAQDLKDLEEIGMTPEQFKNLQATGDMPEGNELTAQDLKDLEEIGMTPEQFKNLQATGDMPETKSTVKFQSPEMTDAEAKERVDQLLADIRAQKK